MTILGEALVILSGINLAFTGIMPPLEDEKTFFTPTPTSSVNGNEKKCLSQIVYSATGIGGSLDIMLMLSDGSEVKNLTHHSAEDKNPSWSPNNDRIVFVSNRGSGSNLIFNLFIMNADGSDVVQLTRGLGSCNHPSWSPDGKTIAFSYEYNRRCEIDLINLDGTHFKQLVSDLNNHSMPVWSPDGKQLAFVSSLWDREKKEMGSRDIYFVNADGTNVAKLTNSPADDYAPIWSADGRKLAFVSTRRGSADIYYINLDDKIAKQLTFIPLSDEDDPTWSPDSRFIAFHSDRDNPLGDIYQISVTGGEWQRLTNSGEDKISFQPNWSGDCR